MRLRLYTFTFPLRHPSTYHQQSRHAFSSSSAAAAREPTLYEILDVPVTASTAEIKKYHPPFLSFLYFPLLTIVITTDDSTPSPFDTIQIVTAKIPKPRPDSLTSRPPTTS